MRNSSSLDWLRFMHTPNDYRVSPKTTNIAYPTIYLGISVRRLALIIIAQSYEKTI